MPSLLGNALAFYDRITDNNNMLCRFLKRHCIHIDRNTFIHRVVHGALFIFSVANVIGSLVLACNTFAMICNYGSARVGVLVVTIITLYFCQIVLLTIAEYIIVIFPREKEIKEEESSSGESGAEEVLLHPMRRDELLDQGPSTQESSFDGPLVQGPSAQGPPVQGPSVQRLPIQGSLHQRPSSQGPSAPAADEFIVETVKCEEKITSMKTMRDSYKMAVKE